MYCEFLGEVESVRVFLEFIFFGVFYGVSVVKNIFWEILG